MSVKTKIYLMIDSHGNRESITVESSSDTGQINCLKDQNGKNVYFEAECYHISKFCMENDIKLKEIDRKEDFDTLWENA